MYMLKEKDLDPETRTHLDIAFASVTYEEYVFRCEVANIRPKPEYEYDAGHYRHVLIPDGRPGEFLMQEVEL